MLFRLDLFEKVRTGSGTVCGGLLSLLMFCLMGGFTFYEFSRYLSDDYTMQLSNSPVTNTPIATELDITLLRMPCHLTSLDIEDDMLGHYVNIGSVSKFRVIDGLPEEEPFELLQQPGDLTQLTLQAFERGEGCRVVGQFTLKEVPGNFHISYHGYFMVIQDLLMRTGERKLDYSFVLHKLAFGNQKRIEGLEAKFPNHTFQLQRVIREMNPDETQEVILRLLRVEQASYSLFTRPEPNYLLTMDSYVYPKGWSNRMQGLFFYLEVGEFNMLVENKKEPLTEFLTWLLAILSGIFYITFLLDSLLRNLVALCLKA